MNIIKKIQIGTYIEFLLSIITLGQSERLALYIAKRFFGRDSCGCCERKQWLNRLTDPHYNGRCNEIKLF